MTDNIPKEDNESPQTKEINVLKPMLLGGMLLFIAAAGYMLKQSVDAARERARRADCAGNFRQIGLGLHMYSGDHQERFPTDLKDVMPYVKQTELFVCPSDTHNFIGKPQPHEVGRYGSYFYIAGLSEADDSDRIHMFDAPWNHEGAGGNILYVGGYVQWVPMKTTDGSEGYWDYLDSKGFNS